ncbi:hypothetical protein [Sulfidibacter corallicola]|uniref:Uncharacterized protein n=1 Tax=Sulfidibacter corallicola TaxID=2818388 RepID=A0A8A4TIA8_SULCO|nr:hypothetical protein [Sulfidibacter corallicola]QTD48892.1 hypothetical protein J3U87_25190 [Sulfidibacter corallicola]
MTKYSVEIGENEEKSTCHCCKRISYNGHGFVYKDNDAYGVYYAAWSPEHEVKQVSFAISLGDWDSSSTIRDRTCFGFQITDDRDDVTFSAIGPESSPWPNSDLLGEMISRQSALIHPLFQEALLISEKVVRSHETISQYLGCA